MRRGRESPLRQGLPANENDHARRAAFALCAWPLAGAHGGLGAGRRCDAYKVDTSLLNISRGRRHHYKDALFDGDTVGVAQKQDVAGSRELHPQKVEADGSARGRRLVAGRNTCRRPEAPQRSDGSAPVQSAPPAQSAPAGQPAATR